MRSDGSLSNDFPWGEVLFQSNYWLDRDRVRHPIAEMETRHLQNAIPYAKSACEAMAWSALRYADKAPDAASDIASQAAEEFMSYDAPLIKALEAELARRAST